MNENLRPNYGFRSNRIPYELERFVRRDTYALLIKGKAGTGKTTLSLTILKTLGQASNFFYISTRISPRQLFTYYPWLEHFVQTLKPQTTGNNEEQVYKMAMFEDARLDEPESLFERITNELMDVKAPIIIIDSWDAIASFMDREARLNNERVLQTWRERAGAKLIFISEDVSYSTLDFLVDGIVELDQSSYDSCRLRQIKLLKLRGVRILNQIYSFSLNNSSFTSFETYKPSDYTLHKIASLQDDLAGRKDFSVKPYSFRGFGRIRTGYPELDTVIGRGLPRKGLVIFKFDPNIHTTAITAFFLRIISNFIKRNNPVLIQPIKYTNPQIILAFLRSYLGYIPDNKVFRILCSDIKDSEIEQYIDPSQYSLIKNSQSGLIERNIEMTRNMYPESLMLSIFNYEQLKGLDEELQQRQTSILSFLNKKTDLSILVGMTGESSYPPLESEADMKFEISLVRGTLFLKPVSPVGPIFALTTYKVNGFPRIRLQVLV
jgi:KaiC/GvpD/RAD55 family RecA-like ATPase